MCGRYGRRGDKQYIAEHYRIRDWQEKGIQFPGLHDAYQFAPSYNIAPAQVQPVIRLNHETGERELAAMKWGLVPYWILLANSMFIKLRPPEGVARPVRDGNFGREYT